jgi:hypothetical protein
MTHWLLAETSKFMRIAGRIPVENYSNQIYNIIEKVRDFMGANHHLKPDEQRIIGEIPFEFNGDIKKLLIKVTSDKYVPVVAGVDGSAKSPYILINLFHFQYMNQAGITQSLKPILVHELTHFIDSLYDPLASKNLNELESDSPFFKDFIKIFTQSPSKLNYSNIDNIKSMDWELIAKRETLKFLKTRIFKDLLIKHNITLDHLLVGKLLKLTHGIYLDDLVFYRDTGGDPFGMMPASKSKKLRENATQMYFTSGTELRAYTNQIIDEVDTIVRHKNSGEMLIEIIKGNESISKYINEFLSESPTFKLIGNNLNNNQIQKIQKEVANFLFKRYSKRGGASNWAEKANINLSPSDELKFRHLLKKLNKDPDGLSKLMNNQSFVESHRKALLALQAYLDFNESLKKIRDSMKGL